MLEGATAKIAVLGSGAWGTALDNLSARAANEVLLWARDAGHVAEMAATGVNARRLPGIPLFSNVLPTANLADIAKAELILAVVPAQAFRVVLAAAAPFIGEGVPIIVCAKGIENITGCFMSDIVGEVLPKNPPVILSGPSFALDVAKGQPTAVTIAARDKSLAAMLAKRLGGPSFRLYYTEDIRGVEIGGAAKNVLAIASGIAAGHGLGASAGAALIARGFAELSRFGRVFGAKPNTLMGLSGLGDLVLTCSSLQGDSQLRPCRRGADLWRLE
jgi:glycerol-3-phosphate dehydrogenase (NAD(P)+)